MQTKPSAANRWENVFPSAGQTTREFEQSYGLIGERDHVLKPAFHLCRGYPPDRVIKVDLLPLGATQLTGTNENKGRKLQRYLGDWHPIIALHCQKQSAYLLWLENRRQMFRLSAGKSAP